ncbi:MAG: chemotaxis-specific protein-glutamate methyltransferase CheB [Bdellovibrionaceae bacterium]|nr:chemotaxis-specific protein-glutamate methyltransferase CheB [Pseudobdellovibrionaceae bacterium]
MKVYRFRSGVVLALIDRKVPQRSRLLCFAAPVNWTDVERQLRTEGQDRVIKAVVTESDEAALKASMSRVGLGIDRMRTLKNGDIRELKLELATGRFLIENADSSKNVMAVPTTNRKEAGPKEVKVLIVDDSKAMRLVLRKMLESEKLIKVIGEAEKPSEALKFLEGAVKPDVITLDIQMPEMSGVELFKVIHARYAIPSVMVSSIGLNQGHEVMDALEAGAFDYFQKPEMSEVAQRGRALQEMLLQAAVSRRHQTKQRDRRDVSGLTKVTLLAGAGDLIAIGASTGGTEAIRRLFERLPPEIPPIVVVQHIPPYFSAAFADRLNRLFSFEVREARDGDEVKRGVVLIAPGGLHMTVEKKDGRLFARVQDGATVNRFKPSVDVLFNSVAKVLGDKATGIILTGMGEDGAKGLLEMKRMGARTIGQDEGSSVVYGMPRAAAELGAVDEVAPLDEIASLLSQARTRAA